MFDLVSSRFKTRTPRLALAVVAAISLPTAHGVNAREQVVGASSTDDGLRAFLYEDGSMWSLGTLGGNSSRAWAISESGRIVGLSRVSVDSFVSHAFLWENGIMTDLGSLGGPDTFSEALALNASGTVVGRSTIAGSQQQRAFRWRRGVMTDVGTVAGLPFSRANGVNASGVIVGTASPFQGFSGRAFVWRSFQITDLNERIPADSGWLLTSAEGVNDRGQIVGFGTFQGQTRAFLLTPYPAPAAPR